MKMGAFVKFIGITIGTIVVVMSGIVVLIALTDGVPRPTWRTQSAYEAPGQSAEYFAAKNARAEQEYQEKHARIEALRPTATPSELRALNAEDFRAFKAAQNAYVEMTENPANPEHLLRMLPNAENPAVGLNGKRLIIYFDFVTLEDYKMTASKFDEIAFRRWQDVDSIEVHARVKFRDGGKDYVGDAVRSTLSRRTAATLNWRNPMMVVYNFLLNVDEAWVHPGVFSSGLVGNVLFPKGNALDRERFANARSPG